MGGNVYPRKEQGANNPKHPRWVAWCGFGAVESHKCARQATNGVRSGYYFTSTHTSTADRPGLASCDLPSPAKRYSERMSRAFESTHSENVTLRKQLKEAGELLGTRKIRKEGKRAALKGRSVFSTEEVLKLVEEAEAETAKKLTRKRRKKRVIKKSNRGRGR